ncbi:MAG TPA: tetratricopeptide repeat protein [Verrucomicrobiae bacterium]|nr:tetratricopeptide repeat protein [Verrucomicrobiae bacterium]
MAQDIEKHLDRGRRSLEKNKLREAVAEYQAVLDEAPTHSEALQALADLYTRLNEPAMAAQYYGAQFDRLVDAGDAAKSSAIFQRFLRPYPQPPDRLMRYATLLQKQARPGDAIEQYGTAARLFEEQAREIEALACLESIALLDPENPARHVTLGQMAEKLGHSDMAARGYFRAGQLTLASGALDEALEYFARAHGLSPDDRAGSMLYAEAKMRKGDAAAAAALLEPFAGSEKDPAFFSLFGEALLRTGQLDRSLEAYEAFYRIKPEGYGKLFEIAGAYVRAGQDQKATAVLAQLKETMHGLRKDQELSTQMDRLAGTYPHSLAVAEVVSKLYEELNRESKYFEALVRLFDLYLEAGRLKEACDSLDRLVDIDPYDYRNHERIAKLEGKVDPAFLQNILARAAKAATVTTRGEGFSGAGSENSARAGNVPEELRAQQALDDLIVQVEIFLQYSLQTKAVERLERIAELFPNEEERNERLRALYDRANWWPKGSKARLAGGPAAAPAAAPPPAAPVAPPPAPVAAPEIPSPAAMASTADTHRDLSAIAEINRLMYRQPTPRDVLTATAAGIGKHLNVTRSLIVTGSTADATQITGEFAAPGVTAASPAEIASIVGIVSRAAPDSLGGVELHASTTPELAALGLQTALGVVLTDKETQAGAGAVLVGSAGPRKWKPNESFFLQAVGDQLVLSVNHTRLRSLVRSLAVADERTGLLNRGSYVDCLLVEANRSRTQNAPLSLVLLTVDRGTELLRQHSDTAVDRFTEQLARGLSSSIRQTDIAVKHTAWSLVFVLPDTSLENARVLAEKLRQIAGTVKPPWGPQDVTVSAIVAQATSRPGDDTEDRVTEWMNRAESGLEEARQRGGNVLVELATP